MLSTLWKPSVLTLSVSSLPRGCAPRYFILPMLPPSLLSFGLDGYGPTASSSSHLHLRDYIGVCGLRYLSPCQDLQKDPWNSQHHESRLRTLLSIRDGLSPSAYRIYVQAISPITRFHSEDLLKVIYHSMDIKILTDSPSRDAEIIRRPATIFATAAEETLQSAHRPPAEHHLGCG
jgi:hypothetical protein